LSTSSDPYPPLENELKLTRETVKVLLERGFKVIIVSKSDLMVRDIDVFRLGRVTVSITITTLDSKLSKLIEPNAPEPSRRIEAIRRLSKHGIPVSVRIDPVIYGLNDDPSELRELVDTIVDAGALHVVTSTYKVKLDNLARMSASFPDLASKWRKLYFREGERMYGYRYLKKELRMKLLTPVVKEASRLGVTYATCREGLLTKEFFDSSSCDGSHLLY